MPFSQWPKIVVKYLGYFCKELSKIAQSGHTAAVSVIQSSVWGRGLKFARMSLYASFVPRWASSNRRKCCNLFWSSSCRSTTCCWRGTRRFRRRPEEVQRVQINSLGLFPHNSLLFLHSPTVGVARIFATNFSNHLMLRRDQREMTCLSRDTNPW